MDILRLPPTFRQLLISKLLPESSRRSFTTTSVHHSTTSHFPPPSGLLTPTSANLNSYTISTPPTPSELRRAGRYFTRYTPSLLYSASHFRNLPDSPFPEVAFLGRSNVGKSSLLNALFGRPNSPVARVSKRPGRTVTLNGYSVGAPLLAPPRKDKGERDEAWRRFAPGGLVVVDMPGYGTGGREVWGQEAWKLLTRRRQLRRTFVLVDVEHGLKGSDVELLAGLKGEGVAVQVVLSKVDKIVHPKARVPGEVGLSEKLGRLRERIEGVRRNLREKVGDDGGDILCCSGEKSLDARGGKWRIGNDELRWCIVNACGLENQINEGDVNVIPEAEGLLEGISILG